MKTGNYSQLIKLLQETREYLARPENDFAWSTWDNATEALAEIDELISRLQAGNPPARSEIEFLFLPTGPVQEVSLSSGWGEEFIKLASRVDATVNRSYGPDPRRLAAHRADLENHISQLFNTRMRWFCTVMTLVAAGFATYMGVSGDRPEVCYPLHLQGQATLYAVTFGMIVFGTLALLNWIFWGRKK